MEARIELTHPNGYSEQRMLGLGRYRVGREGAEIVLADPNVSTIHAELIVEPGRLVLADLGSLNGTFGPDGQRITAPIVLYPGQAARVAGSRLALLEPLRAATGTQAMPQFRGAPPRAAPVPAAAAAPGFSASGPPGAAPQRARGSIIKLPDATPGLLVISGNQVPFQLTGTWRSPVAPAVNQTLEVELDGRGAIVSLTVIDGQQLARERLEAAANLAGEHGKRAAAAAKRVAGSANHVTVLVLGAAGVFLLGLIGIGWWLFGDRLSERSLAAKIDEQLEEKGAKVCWDLSHGSQLAFPVRVSNLMGEVSRNPIAVGLHKGGYISLTPERPVPGASLFGGDGEAHQFILDVTPKGKEEAVWDSSSGFCIGRRGVDGVDRWTEPAEGDGMQAVRIDYKWKVVDRPSWATEELFSSVPGVKEPVEDIAVAQKMSDGWTIVSY